MRRGKVKENSETKERGSAEPSWTVISHCKIPSSAFRISLEYCKVAGVRMKYQNLAATGGELSWPAKEAEDEIVRPEHS